MACYFGCCNCCAWPCPCNCAPCNNCCRRCCSCVSMSPTPTPNYNQDCDPGCDSGSVCGGYGYPGCCNSYPGERPPWRPSPGPNVVKACTSKYRCTPPREFAVANGPRGCPSCCCF